MPRLLPFLFLLPLLLSIPHARAADKSVRVLTEAQRDAVQKEVHACWHLPAGAEVSGPISLLVVVDEANKAVDATIAAEDADRVDTPALRPYARSVLAAVVDPDCAHLSIPDGNLGRPWLFRFPFTP